MPMEPLEFEGPASAPRSQNPEAKPALRPIQFGILGFILGGALLSVCILGLPRLLAGSVATSEDDVSSSLAETAMLLEPHVALKPSFCEDKNIGEDACADLRSGCASAALSILPGSSLTCAEKARRHEADEIGSGAPTCLADGTYAARQCQAVDDCWCTDRAGQELRGTRGLGSATLSEEVCKELREECSTQGLCTKVAKEAETLQGSSPRVVGLFVPKCTASGDFIPRQCWASTGQCWCVDEKGKALAGTRSRPGPSEEDCVSKLHLAVPRTPCEEARQKAMQTTMLGQMVPQCQADGSYSSLQCHPSSGYCWCVDETGREVSDTESRDMTEENCATHLAAATPASTACGTQHEAAIAKSQHTIGVFVPTCAKDGTFAARQCFGSTGQCWCTDEIGNELHGTRFRPGPADEDTCMSLRNQCSASLADGCQMPPRGEGECETVVEKYFFNAKSGKCEKTPIAGCTGNDNSFSSTEECSSKCPFEASLTCTARAEMASQLEKKGLLGVFAPDCSTDGSWDAMQCHHDLGCWCVDYKGVAYSGTLRGPGDAEKLSACQNLRQSCTPCASPQESRCSEDNQRQGVNCIVGSCVKLEESTQVLQIARLI